MTRPNLSVQFAFAALGAFALAASVGAQNLPALKPGAWEITSTATSKGPDMSAHMAKLPPELQAQMKKNMGKAAMSHTGIKHCARPNDQQLAQSMQQQMGADMKCATSNVSQAGSTYKWDSKCSGSVTGGAPMTIESSHTMVLKGDSAFEHTYTSKSPGAPMGVGDGGGGTTGKFLGTDCAAFGALTMEERQKQFDQMRADRARGREERQRERVQIRMGKE